MPLSDEERASASVGSDSSRIEAVGSDGTVIDKFGRFVDRHLQSIRLGLNATLLGLSALLIRHLARSKVFATYKTQHELLAAARKEPQQLWACVHASQCAMITAYHVPDWRAVMALSRISAEQHPLHFRIWPLDDSASLNVAAKSWVRLKTLPLTDVSESSSPAALPATASAKDRPWQRRYDVAHHCIAQGLAKLDLDAITAVYSDLASGVTESSEAPTAIKPSETEARSSDSSATARAVAPMPSPELLDYVKTLLGAEAQARAEGKGLWSTLDRDPAAKGSEWMRRIFGQ
eukprot:TRINITY_DN2961_c0_g1_i1.p1 TRINITY_DN2961_c0_g1~~TRINITY_DN2961_c0_g1_i1.p1  ORF type:complete len:291 (+),score=26.81 TRINITY_DN2961_c0_g1_i1:25-897(+)